MGRGFYQRRWMPHSCLTGRGISRISGSRGLLGISRYSCNNGVEPEERQMTELSDHYMRVRDYARRFSLDESTVYKMIERGEIKAIRIGKKTLRIPSSEL